MAISILLHLCDRSFTFAHLPMTSLVDLSIPEKSRTQQIFTKKKVLSANFINNQVKLIRLQKDQGFSKHMQLLILAMMIYTYQATRNCISISISKFASYMSTSDLYLDYIHQKDGTEQICKLRAYSSCHDRVVSHMPL